MTGPKALPHSSVLVGSASQTEEGWCGSFSLGRLASQGPCRVRSLLSGFQVFQPKTKAKPGTPALSPEKRADSCSFGFLSVSGFPPLSSGSPLPGLWGTL